MSKHKPKAFPTSDRPNSKAVRERLSSTSTSHHRPLSLQNDQSVTSDSEMQLLKNDGPNANELLQNLKIQNISKKGDPNPTHSGVKPSEIEPDSLYENKHKENIMEFSDPHRSSSGYSEDTRKEGDYLLNLDDMKPENIESTRNECHDEEKLSDAKPVHVSPIAPVSSRIAVNFVRGSHFNRVHESSRVQGSKSSNKNKDIDSEIPTVSSNTESLKNEGANKDNLKINVNMGSLNRDNITGDANIDRSRPHSSNRDGIQSKHANGESSQSDNISRDTACRDGGSKHDVSHLNANRDFSKHQSSKQESHTNADRDIPPIALQNMSLNTNTNTEEESIKNCVTDHLQMSSDVAKDAVKTRLLGDKSTKRHNRRRSASKNRSKLSMSGVLSPQDLQMKDEAAKNVQVNDLGIEGSNDAVVRKKGDNFGRKNPSRKAKNAQNNTSSEENMHSNNECPVVFSGSNRQNSLNTDIHSNNKSSAQFLGSNSRNSLNTDIHSNNKSPVIFSRSEKTNTMNVEIGSGECSSVSDRLLNSTNSRQSKSACNKNIDNTDSFRKNTNSNKGGPYDTNTINVNKGSKNTGKTNANTTKKINELVNDTDNTINVNKGSKNTGKTNANTTNKINELVNDTDNTINVNKGSKNTGKTNANTTKKINELVNDTDNTSNVNKGSKNTGKTNANTAKKINELVNNVTNMSNDDGNSLSNTDTSHQNSFPKSTNFSDENREKLMNSEIEDTNKIVIPQKRKTIAECRGMDPFGRPIEDSVFEAPPRVSDVYIPPNLRSKAGQYGSKFGSLRDRLSDHGVYNRRDAWSVNHRGRSADGGRHAMKRGDAVLYADIDPSNPLSLYLRPAYFDMSTVLSLMHDLSSVSDSLLKSKAMHLLTLKNTIICSKLVGTRNLSNLKDLLKKTNLLSVNKNNKLNSGSSAKTFNQESQHMKNSKGSGIHVKNTQSVNTAAQPSNSANDGRLIDSSLLEYVQRLPFNPLLSFTDLNIKCSVLNTLTPTPVQSFSIPAILSDSDVLCRAPTGSGKTLAFLIPIVMLVENNLCSLCLNSNKSLSNSFDFYCVKCGKPVFLSNIKETESSQSNPLKSTPSAHSTTVSSFNGSDPTTKSSFNGSDPTTKSSFNGSNPTTKSSFNGSDPTKSSFSAAWPNQGSFDRIYDNPFEDPSSSHSGKRFLPNIKAVILTPTRELAAQIGDHLKTLTNLRIAVITGGHSMSLQKTALTTCTYVIATPGRLCDHLSNMTMDPVFLVLDEGDRMLDMGFSRELNFISTFCKKAKRCLFSATFEDAILKTAVHMLNDPVIVSVVSETVADICQRFLFAENHSSKISYLVEILFEGNLHIDAFGHFQKSNVCANQPIRGAFGTDSNSESAKKFTDSRGENFAITANMDSQNFSNSSGRSTMQINEKTGNDYKDSQNFSNSSGRSTMQINEKTGNDFDDDQNFSNSISPNATQTAGGCPKDNIESRLHKIDVKKDLVIVFTETKATCKKIEQFLRQKINVTSIHGDKDQREREHSLRLFATRQTNVLVATSVAARGLDIPDVKLVINYDMPQCAKEYIHRIGRTGRCGKEGLAVSFVDANCRIVGDIVSCLQDISVTVPEFMKNFQNHVKNLSKGREPYGRGTSLHRSGFNDRESGFFGKSSASNRGGSGSFHRDSGQISNYENRFSRGRNAGFSHHRKEENQIQSIFSEGAYTPKQEEDDSFENDASSSE